MYDYTVLDVARVGAKATLCLRGEDGRFHVARATATVPAVGDRLFGDKPALGFGLLLGAPIDQVFRVIFEAVHCSEDEAHESIHGGLTP